MRYVPIEQLETGMVLAQGLHDASGLMLLNKGTVLTSRNIDYMKYLGTAGVYIDDEISKGIEEEAVVRPEVKREAVSAIHSFFSKSESKENLDAEERMVRLVVENVVEDVLSNKDVMYNMMDIKTYDDYAYFHALNVGVLAGVLGVRLELSDNSMNQLVTAAFLHDIGKTFVLPEVSKEMRRLTPEEKETMKAHAWAGYEYLRQNFNFGDKVNLAVYDHHEWYNGNGYPRKLKQRDINRLARILKVADVYDSMTSKLPYRSSYQPAEVFEYIMARNGSEFDPKVVEAMVEGFCIYPIGSEVVLSNGRHAIVVKNYPGFIQRPLVRTMDDGTEIDLRTDRNAYNVTIVQLIL